MAEPSRLQYFPATHLAGVVIALVLILSILLWPSGNNRQITSLKIALPDSPALPADVDREDKWEQDKVKSGDSLSTLFT